MIKLTDEMRDLINHALVNGTPCIVATASPDGVPNLGYRGSMMVFDDESLAYWERGRRSSLEHLEDNPKTVVLFRHPEQRIAWKFRCTASVHREGPIRDRVMAQVIELELNRDPDREGIAVVLRVEQIVSLAGEVLQERVPNFRW